MLIFCIPTKFPGVEQVRRATLRCSGESRRPLRSCSRSDQGSAWVAASVLDAWQAWSGIIFSVDRSDQHFPGNDRDDFESRIFSIFHSFSRIVKRHFSSIISELTERFFLRLGYVASIWFLSTPTSTWSLKINCLKCFGSHIIEIASSYV